MVYFWWFHSSLVAVLISKLLNIKVVGTGAVHMFDESGSPDFYKKSFPVKRGLDHPNEISAYMFSEFFKAEFNLKQPFEKAIGIANKNAEQFMEWIKTEMN